LRVDGLIIAGGQSSRMGQFKASVNFLGQPLINHVFERLQTQVDNIFINSNRLIPSLNLKTKMIEDEISNYQGPLAGLQAGLRQINCQWLQIAPCDTPFIPLDLTEKLISTAINTDKPIIVPSVNDRLHPTLGLMNQSILPLLDQFLETGQRGFIQFIKHVGYLSTPFADEKPFTNINSHNDLKKYEKN
jgi:molybdopterin-guanine dinucleotide biosynthesis protein A